MNPFEENNEEPQDTNVTNDTDTNVNIWVVINGRKKNTYITGWNIPEDDLKEHLKTIKKKNGCNGSVKSLPNESNNGFVITMQFQGDHADYVKDYLIKNGVDVNNIQVRG